MSIELDIVRDVSDRLSRANIAFMLTGSMAMNAYAQPRMTRDVDVVIEVQSSDLQKLVSAFRPDYFIDEAAVERALRNETLFNIIHAKLVFKVDCIVRKNTPYRLDRIRSAPPVARGRLRNLGRKQGDLILSKLCWGNDSKSEYQARDIRNLLANGCDRDYVLKWAAELNVLEYLTTIEK